MDIDALQATLRHFAAERRWQPFHNPKNLVMALSVEAAELVELFQWLTPEQAAAVADDPAQRQHVGEEVADVLLYLLQLADHCRIDLDAVVADKLARNARKHRVPGADEGPADGSADGSADRPADSLANAPKLG